MFNASIHEQIRTLTISDLVLTSTLFSGGVVLSWITAHHGGAVWIVAAIVVGALNLIWWKAAIDSIQADASWAEHQQRVQVLINANRQAARTRTRVYS